MTGNSGCLSDQINYVWWVNGLQRAYTHTLVILLVIESAYSEQARTSGYSNGSYSAHRRGMVTLCVLLVTSVGWKTHLLSNGYRLHAPIQYPLFVGTSGAPISNSNTWVAGKWPQNWLRIIRKPQQVKPSIIQILKKHKFKKSHHWFSLLKKHQQWRPRLKR